MSQQRLSKSILINGSFICRWGICLIVFSLGFSSELFPDWEPQFQGQLNTWITLEENFPLLGRNGIRYLPTWQGGNSLSSGWEMDYEATGNLYGTRGKEGPEEEVMSQEDLKAHRLWARAFTEQLEVRLGLQKINFGPGKTLRALQWFDQIDPRDPTHFTEGVKGGLLRYYFPNNANLWTWLLYGNEETFGISPFTTDENTPELGGRLQSPIGLGEMAISFHHRQVDSTRLTSINSPGGKSSQAENRIGLDGQWDVGVGLWFEATWMELEETPVLSHRQQWIMSGMDYTFDLGNGLYTVLEGMQIETSSHQNHLNVQSIIALTQSYPLNLLDQVQLIAMWESEPESTSLHTQWQRTEDNLIFNVTLGIRERTKTETITDSSLATQTSERSLQLLLQYNH